MLYHYTVPWLQSYSENMKHCWICCIIITTIVFRRYKTLLKYIISYTVPDYYCNQKMRMSLASSLTSTNRFWFSIIIHRVVYAWKIFIQLKFRLREVKNLHIRVSLTCGIRLCENIDVTQWLITVVYFVSCFLCPDEFCE